MVGCFSATPSTSRAQELDSAYLSGSSITDKNELEGWDSWCSFRHVEVGFLLLGSEVNRGRWDVERLR